MLSCCTENKATRFIGANGKCNRGHETMDLHTLLTFPGTETELVFCPDCPFQAWTLCSIALMEDILTHWWAESSPGGKMLDLNLSCLRRRLFLDFPSCMLKLDYCIEGTALPYVWNECHNYVVLALCCQNGRNTEWLRGSIFIFLQGVREVFCCLAWSVMWQQW